jgi:hypothetical protein
LSLPGCAFAALDEVGERVDLQHGAGGHPQKIVNDRRDPHELLGIVRQPLVQQVVEGDDAAERKQERVVVASREETGDGGDAVGALAVLHHHRLPPALGEPLRDQARRQVHAAAWRQRNDEAHGSLWPSLSLSLSLRDRRCERQHQPGNQRSDSEVRQDSRRAQIRTSESKDH